MYTNWNDDLEGDLQVIERCIARWRRQPSCADKDKNLRNLVRCRTDLLLLKSSCTLDALHDDKVRR